MRRRLGYLADCAESSSCGVGTAAFSIFRRPENLSPLAATAFARYSHIHPTRFTIADWPLPITDFELSVNGNSVQGWIAASALVRRTMEAVGRTAGRRHLARFDRVAPARCQRRILLGLVHQAQSTRFGRDHDFRRIRTVADYRRLVPLASRAELWRDYWQPAYPHLAGATWPGRSTNGRADCDDSIRRTPPSAALQAAHRAALRTALALAQRYQPHSRFLSGNFLSLTDEGPSHRTEHPILAERLPVLLRPFTVLSADIEAERFAHLSVSGLIGPAERLLSLLEAVKQVRGKRCLRDIWPQLSLVLFTRSARQSAGVPKLRIEAGEDVLVLEMVGRAEGPIAVEDPRFASPRLLFDHGVYFEFVPANRAEEPCCPRFGIEEIEVGVPYELAVTSPAGLWACRLGRTVCLQRRDPPLLRFVETAIRQPTAADIRRPDGARSVSEGRPSLAYASGPEDKGASSTKRRQSGSAARKCLP